MNSQNNIIFLIWYLYLNPCVQHSVVQNVIASRKRRDLMNGLIAWTAWSCEQRDRVMLNSREGQFLGGKMVDFDLSARVNCNS